VQKYNTQFITSASLSLSFYQVVSLVMNQMSRICTLIPYLSD